MTTATAKPVTARVRKAQGEPAPKPKQKHRGLGTSCESSRLYPCPSRAYELRDYEGYRIWVCEMCKARLTRAGFFSFYVRDWNRDHTGPGTLEGLV